MDMPPKQRRAEPRIGSRMVFWQISGFLIGSLIPAAYFAVLYLLRYDGLGLSVFIVTPLLGTIGAILGMLWASREDS
jgi:predicted membrane channel-forming protein YqfA (hemolysin III family)